MAYAPRKKRQSKRARVLERLGKRNIVFLGMMGCGKSAIGKMLATRLGLEFVDADQEIETAANRSIPDIFEDFGEEEFRRLETKVIERVLSDGPVLLALGGGAFMAEDTRKAIAQNSVSIWLKADLDILLERVMRKPGKRPLLAKGDPKTIIGDLLKKREPVYALSDLHVKTPRGTKSETREKVLSELDNFLNLELREQA